MNDIQYELAVDTASKKATAASSKHRVSRGGHYTRMPSDALTEAQKKKLSGPCTSYDLSRPMPWDIFKEMPHDIQQEYLNKLVSMGGTQDSIFKMFGSPFSHKNSMRYWLRKNNLKLETHNRCVPLNDFVMFANKKPVEEITETVVEPETEVTVTKSEACAPIVASRMSYEQEAPFHAVKGNVTLYANPQEVRNFLSVMCGNDRMKLTVIWGGEIDA